MVVMGFAAMTYYDFSQYKQAPESPYVARKSQIDLMRKEIAALEKKNGEMLEFVKTLETKKQEVGQLSTRLFELKAAMSDRLDVPEFTRMIVTEAKRVGLTVQSIRPQQRMDTEYYRVFPFELKFRGVFPQIYTFMSRVANLQKLVRIDRFTLSPATSSSSKFVELEGEIELKTFAYLGSQADTIAGKSSAEAGSKGGQ